jgi:hypothetical protein
VNWNVGKLVCSTSTVATAVGSTVNTADCVTPPAWAEMVTCVDVDTLPV